MVTKVLKKRVMKIAYDLIFGGNVLIKKPEIKFKPNFYWAVLGCKATSSGFLDDLMCAERQLPKSLFPMHC